MKYLMFILPVSMPCVCSLSVHSIVGMLWLISVSILEDFYTLDITADDGDPTILNTYGGSYRHYSTI